MANVQTATAVLTVLSNGPHDGYLLAREIETQTTTPLYTHGDLYPVLYALELDGLIVGKWERSGSQRRSRVYSITDLGAAQLVERRPTLKERLSSTARLLGGKLREQTA